MNTRLLASATADVLAIAAAYDAAAPGGGTRFLQAVDALVANLTAHPRMYGRVPRAPRGREVRHMLVPGSRFRAVYEVTATEVVILSVTHARSRRQPWRQRLP